jgi:hypothetical protein
VSGEAIALQEATALDWMELHLRCLHHHDANDRIVHERQAGGGRAPRFHLGRTPLGNLWRFRDDLPLAQVRDLARLAGREPPLGAGEPPAPPDRMPALREVLAASGAHIVEWRGPAYRFPKRLATPSIEAEVVEIGPGDAGLLAGPLADWAPELGDRLPCVAAVVRGHALAVCCSSRPLEVAGSPASPVAEAGVETVPEARGRGLAPAVVAAWGRAVRARGGEPAYSTSWENRASRAVARKLGLILYGEDLHFT